MANIDCTDGGDWGYERPCPCGSGKEREDVTDARGIFVAYVCDKCRKEKLKGYRREIFEDPNYDTFGETIEPEEGLW